MNWFRAQHSGYTFEQMKQHNSQDGGDECGHLGGICATSGVMELIHNTVMGAMSDDDDVVVFQGFKVCDIYDGARVTPVRELARFSVRHFRDHAEEIAEKYESW